MRGVRTVYCLLASQFLSLPLNFVTSLKVHFSLYILIVCVMMSMGCESALKRQVAHFEQVRDHDSAIQMLEREVQSRPSNAEAHYHLGRLYLKQLRHVEGREALEKAIALSGRFAEQSRYELDNRLSETLHAGVASLGNRVLDEAVTQFTYATEVAPSSAVAFKGLGNAYAASGNRPEAEKAFREAVRLQPEDIEVWLNLSELALREEAYIKAIEDARQVLALEPVNPDALKRLAYASMLAEQFEVADSTFQQYLNLPGGQHAVRDYAFMSFNAGRYEVAVPYLQDLAQKGDPQAELRFMLGEAYLALGQYEDMVALYENILQQFPDNVYALQGLLIAHERLGNTAKTLSIRQRLKSISGITSSR